MSRIEKTVRDKRHVHGILLLDKPAGSTSNDVLRQIKYLYQATKAGHTGTLDKLATGMLPICLGEATKISSYLLNADKTYIATAKLGITTSTADAAGEILEIRPLPSLTQTDLKHVISRFIGDIDQVPPMYSALRIAGERLYRLVYKGLTVERQPRLVTIYRIDLLDFDHESFTIQIRCSKGTYIRALIEDIGHALGCGAHVLNLRRLSTGVFNAEQMVSVKRIIDLKEQDNDYKLLDQLLVEMDKALSHLHKVYLSVQQTSDFHHGQTLSISSKKKIGSVRIYDHKFIGIGDAQDGQHIAPKRVLRAELFH